MVSEEDLFRSPPQRPYRCVDGRLRVPIQALTATLKLLEAAGSRECGVFWYGPREDAYTGTVAYVVAPRQRMDRGNYYVSADALTEIVYRLPGDWKPLAQIHSHPGTYVEHSTYDDRMMSSRRALSLVFPSYGRNTETFPTGIGVHEWQDDYWHLLEADAACRRVVLVAGATLVEDLR